MVFGICGLAMIPKYRTFATKIEKMTQKEAIIEALKRLGGKASLNDIYQTTYTLADFTGSRDWKATIRCYLQKETAMFRSSERGCWELVSYQEDIASRNLRIAELEALLAAKDKEIAELKQQETVEHFVDRMIIAAKTMFATKRNDARPVQQLLVVMNRLEQQVLMEWIIGKPTKVTNKTFTKMVILDLQRRLYKNLIVFMVRKYPLKVLMLIPRQTKKK